MNTINNNTAHNDDKMIVSIIWILYFFGFFTTGLTTLAGLIVAYLKINKGYDPIVMDHIRAAIKIFWYGLFWIIIGWFLHFLLIGFIVWIIAGIWYFYSCIKGLVQIQDYDYFYKKK